MSLSSNVYAFAGRHRIGDVEVRYTRIVAGIVRNSWCARSFWIGCIYSNDSIQLTNKRFYSKCLSVAMDLFFTIFKSLLIVGIFFFNLQTIHWRTYTMHNWWFDTGTCHQYILFFYDNLYRGMCAGCIV